MVNMAEFSFKLQFDKYKKFITDNPLLVSEIEVALKWISYIVAGRISQSAVTSELIHSASNLLTLINDSILRKAANLTLYNNEVVEKLQMILSVIEYIEVFAELAANRVGGTYTRWLVIVVIHLIKLAIRLILLVKYRQGMHLAPSIPPLNRKAEVPEFCDQDAPPKEQHPNLELAFTLKRSGRIMRSIQAAPPISGRTWKLPQHDDKDSKNRKFPPTPLTTHLLAAELLHIFRPFLHLMAMRTFGMRSWKPWLISLSMDCTSLQLLRHSNKQLNYAERLELSRRAFQILLYIMRTPFYEKYSRLYIILLLSYMSEKFRLLGLILRPLLEYLPDWQKTYFYTWSL